MRDLPDDHDLDHLQVALSYCTDFSCAIDCGAHRGIWTRVLCDRFAEVTAIEPSDLADRIDPRARIVRAAAGRAPGRCALLPGAENSGQTHCTAGDEVDVITIDSLGLSPDFLKLDVEGWELFALQGAAATIDRYRPAVCLEENGLCRRYQVEPGAAGRLLESWGYTLRQRCNKDYMYSC